MTRRAVKYYPEPAYPTGATADPSLLREHLPMGWQVDGTVAGAVVLLMTLGNAGCSANPQPTTAAPSASTGPVVSVGPTGESAAEPASEPERVVTTAPARALVAPIFAHGEGRGATGCVVVSPPVFLSEEEALSVIRQELARHGIQLSEYSPDIPEVRIPRRKAKWVRDGSGHMVPKEIEVPGSAMSLELDAECLDGHVAVEFVSEEDYFSLGGIESGTSVQDYDLKKVAGEVAQRIARDGKKRAYFGVFYDPVRQVRRSELQGRGWRYAPPALTAKSKGLLRKQVKDFVRWLRTQV